jgi:hypothetical protein
MSTPSCSLHGDMTRSFSLVEPHLWMAHQIAGPERCLFAFSARERVSDHPLRAQARPVPGYCERCEWRTARNPGSSFCAAPQA